MSSKAAALFVLTAALLFLVPAVALCDVCDASDVEIEELSDSVDGFKFGQQPENVGISIVVTVILVVIIAVVLVLLLKLRKKTHDGHY